MAMFGNLLKRKKPTVDVPAGFGMDKSQLNRRMGTILARSTRHELKAPSLVPDEANLAAHAASARPSTSDDSAGNADAMPVNAAAMAREAARQAVEATDHSSQGEATSFYASESEAEDEAAHVAEMAIHETAAPSAESHSDNSMEALRAKLKASLSALRDGEPEMETEAEPVAQLNEPELAAPVATSFGEKAQRALAAPDAHDDEPAQEDLMATPEVIMIPPQIDEPALLEPAAEDEAESIAEEAAMPVDAPEEAPEAAVIFEDQPLAFEPSETEFVTVAEPAADAGSALASPAALAPVTAIYLTREALSGDQPEAASDLVVQIIDYLMYDAGYYPEELPLNGVRAWCMDFYVKNVLEGGFGTFVYNAHGQPEIWEACAAGMEAAGALEHLDVFDGLRNLLAHDAALAVALGDNASAGQDHADLATLEEEFSALEARTPLVRSAGLWLASLPEVEMVSEDELQTIVTGLAEHPDLDARRQQNG